MGVVWRCHLSARCARRTASHSRSVSEGLCAHPALQTLRTEGEQAMSDNPVDVYRTKNPEVIAAFHEQERALEEWDWKCQAFAKQHTGTTDFYSSDGLGQLAMVGLVCRGSDDGPPDGWRHDRQIEMLLPDKRSKLGKQYARDMAALATAPNVRDALRGMPVLVHGRSTGQGAKVWTSGVGMTPDGAVECAWGCHVPASDVDPEVWTKIPLSQYHAEMEANEP